MIWGGYGGGNVGDELCLAVAVHDARERFGSTPTVVSRNPLVTARLFPAVRVIGYSVPLADWIRRGRRQIYLRWRRRGLVPDLYRLALRVGRRRPQWLEAVESASVLYLSGGGYLTDLFDVDHFLQPVRAATAAGVRVESAPIGIGPFSSATLDAAAAGALRHVSLRVRDRESRAWCAGHGIDATLCADDGHRLTDALPWNAALEPVDAQRAEIGVNINEQGGGETLDRLTTWWSDTLKAVHRLTTPAMLEGFCFHTHPGTDFAATQRLLGQITPGARTRPPAADPASAVAQVKRYRAVLTTRFHAAVAAATLGVPCVAVFSGSYYRAKMCSLQGMANFLAVEAGRTAPEQVAVALAHSMSEA